MNHVAMVEDVRRAVEIMEALGREHHAHILSTIEQRHRPQEEVLPRHLPF